MCMKLQAVVSVTERDAYQARFQNRWFVRLSSVSRLWVFVPEGCLGTASADRHAVSLWMYLMNSIR